MSAAPAVGAQVVGAQLAGARVAGGHVLRGRVVTPDGVLPDGVVATEAGRITWVGPVREWPLPTPDPTAATLLPGLVDVHCHGGAGHGFPETGAAGARAAARHHRNHGTTSLMASLVSAPAAHLLAQVEILAEQVRQGQLLGVHLEGPFLSPARCGAQDPLAIVDGDPDLLAALLDSGRGTVRSMTLAPETARAGELLALCRRHGVLPSVGHTDASSSVVSGFLRMATDGAVSATHLFNGMPPLHHRAPGPVAVCLAAAARGELVVELVGDGVHLADDTVAAVFDLVGPGQVALVTDAMAAAGMPDGSYALGSLDVQVDGGIARLAHGAAGQDHAIAGGTSILLDVLRRTVHCAGVDLHSAVTAASATPAVLLGLGNEVGALRAGLRADVLVTDDDLRPLRVLQGGRWVNDDEDS